MFGLSSVVFVGIQTYMNTYKYMHMYMYVKYVIYVYIHIDMHMIYYFAVLVFQLFSLEIGFC